jgi:DNA-binding NarL/FixJ family response regulator
MIRLLLVDDHPVVREGLAAVLEEESDFTVVGTAGSVAEASIRVRELQPDVLLLDLELPDGLGVDLLPALRTDLPSVAVLIFTAYDTDDRILAAIRAGARGYLLKGASAEEIARAIRTVASGGSYLGAQAASTVFSAATETRKSPSNAQNQLTNREQEVLRTVVEGLSNKQIALSLGITERTVKFHLSSLLRKLDAESRAQVAVIAVRRGLV